MKITDIFRLLIVLILILVCVGTAGLFLAGDQLPKMASAKFGPPGRRLSFSQRILYSSRVLAGERGLLVPVDSGGAERSFEVGLGESVDGIAARLQQEGFISSADMFRTYLIYAGLDTGVQAGKYQLSPSMTTVEIARLLQDAVPEDVEFHILAGWRAEEIAAALPTSGINVAPGEFMEIVRNPPGDLLPEGVDDLDTLEGFMLPGSYSIKREIDARALISIFVQRFNESVDTDLREAIREQGLEIPGAVTLASIVEREAMVVDEQPIIASVFYNRLANSMKLDSDPTVQYVLGYQPAVNSWWKNPLYRDDLQVDSRYNTYVYPGLPPAPICNPGIEALNAVAFPASTGYFYFRAKCDGSNRHAFSITYEEHLKNACP